MTTLQFERASDEAVLSWATGKRAGLGHPLNRFINPLFVPFMVEGPWWAGGGERYVTGWCTVSTPGSDSGSIQESACSISVCTLFLITGVPSHQNHEPYGANLLDTASLWLVLGGLFTASC